MANQLLNDRALDPASEPDRLGFTPLANSLALAIGSSALNNGLVIGLEGKWGSGKSSLIAILRGILASQPDSSRPELVDFRPWLIGNRDALLAALFSDLGRALDAISLRRGDATPSSITASKDAAEKLRKFAARLEPIGDLLDLAAKVHPAFGIVSKLTRSASKAAKEASKGPSLSKLKSQLDNSLSQVSSKIVVIIDDVDRLEPDEVVEILRLVRSVADFKNVVYVLCYDPRAIAEAVTTATRIADGRAFLEKIVQISVPIPEPEPFLLRRWFEEGIEPIASGLQTGDRSRLRSVVDAEGGRRLLTPRSVIRALNSVSFSWAALGHRVDFPDLVWLQLIRSSDPELYRWIETYVANLSVTKSSRASITADGINSSFEKLKKIVESDSRELKNVVTDMSQHLLGFAGYDMSSSGPKIFKEPSEADWNKSITDRRLSSPDHYRLYFAFEDPPLALSENDSRDYEEAIASGDSFQKLFSMWLSEIKSAGMSKGAVFLERLAMKDPKSISEKEAVTLISTFSNIMDQSVGTADDDSWLGPEGWRESYKVLPVLLAKLSPENRDASIRNMFEQGSSIAWLTRLFRDEFFAHGRYGDRKRPSEEWLFTDHELDSIIRMMIARFEALGLSGACETFSPATIFYAWKQADAESFSKALEREARSDEGFLEILNGLKSQVHSNRGNYMHISRENAESIFGHEAAKQRLIRIAEREGDPLSVRAKDLLDLLDDDR